MRPKIRDKDFFNLDEINFVSRTYNFFSSIFYLNNLLTLRMLTYVLSSAIFWKQASALLFPKSSSVR